MKKISVLIIEDETAIRDMIRFSLPSKDFDVFESENITEAIRSIADHVPNIVILDWMLPGKSGLEFIQWIKEQDLLKEIPIIMLTAKAEEENKIKGLEAGADDYITKPFSTGELIARIKTILRRGPMVTTSGLIQVKDLCINVNTHQVTIGAEKLVLSPVEYKLLYFFMTHPNRLYSRDHLITLVWGGNVYIDERTVDVQIRRLRARLKPFGYHSFIKTVRGAGYQFVEESEAT